MTDATVDVSVPEKGASPLRFSSFRPRQMVGVIGGLLIVGLIVTAAFTIMRSRNQQLDAAAHELSQLSLTLSEETARTMQSVDLMLTDIQSQLDVAGVIAPADLGRNLLHHLDVAAVPERLRQNERLATDLGQGVTDFVRTIRGIQIDENHAQLRGGVLGERQIGRAHV